MRQRARDRNDDKFRRDDRMNQSRFLPGVAALVFSEMRINRILLALTCLTSSKKAPVVFN
jgi:hypothetical protein